MQRTNVQRNGVQSVPCTCPVFVTNLEGKVGKVGKIGKVGKVGRVGKVGKVGKAGQSYFVH